MIYKKNGIIGLYNDKNSCYMNSTLQFLSHIYLNFYIIKNIRINAKNDKFTFYFYNFLKKKWFSQYKYTIYNITSFKSYISSLNNYYIGNYQHDSHEFLLFFLDNLFKSNSFFINDFSGIYLSTIKCSICSYISKSHETFYTFDLEINFNTLEKCLHNFLKKQSLSYNNYWKCYKCNKFVNATKKISIIKYPKNFIILFKRFSFHNNIFNKSNKYISFPILFKNFTLTSIINHYGSIDSGHYTCIGKSPLNNKWIIYNDTKSQYINNFNIKDFYNSAYILLYKN